MSNENPCQATISSVKPSQPVMPSPKPAQHYENFPVASFLCPRHLRAPIAAIYWFARTADDLADEGDAPAQQRLEELAAYRADLQAVASGQPHGERWPQIFAPLTKVIATFKLPTSLLEDLLDAFVQDVIKTRDHTGYDTQAELLDYCRRSANPVGRLLLHLYGVQDTESLCRSDDICTALQLINFWQDLSVDIPRGRYYLPAQDCAAHAVSMQDLQDLHQTPGATKLIAEQVHIARTMMQNSASLVHHIPGRAGWELRLVVQGGLRILDKIEAMQFATLKVRPRVRAWDAPLLLWRSIWM